MLTVRPSAERGYADHGWLKSFHSFSFADYQSPEHMGFGNLRVINEDRIAPGTGFGTHGHRDMEIVSYVLSGALAHKDSLGAGDANALPGVIQPGDMQRMSAGTGVRHSEFNHSQDEVTHFLQIWILPDALGRAPSYEQKHFTATDKRGRLCLVASREAREGSMRIHADASLWAGLFDGAERLNTALDPNRLTYVHLVHGELQVNGRALQGGDAALLSGESQLQLAEGHQAEVLVFDLVNFPPIR